MSSDQPIQEAGSAASPMFHVSNASVLITGGNFTNVTNISPPTGNYPDYRKVIQESFRDYIAPNATHDTSDLVDPPRCHPKTRRAILRKLKDWLKLGPTNIALIFWLFGPAGAGKSAIARSLAELLAEEQLLAASFFFFGTADKRNNEKLLISTIAYQLAFTVPELQPHIAAAVDTNPLVFQQSLETQLEKLIINPMSLLQSGSERPQAIIIDGLDECRDRDAQRLVLTIIQKAASRLSGAFKFFILSRPEHHIEAVFRLPNLSSITTSMNLKKDLEAYDDIRIFLQDRIDEIKATHPLSSKINSAWPGEDVIEDLVQRSSGNFIYPQTVMKYIQITYGRPQDRLNVILGLSPNLYFDSPFAELDNLYHHILSRARLDRRELLRLLAVLLACTMTAKVDLDVNPVVQPEYAWLGYFSTTEFIEKILFLQAGDVETKLIDLKSLIDFNHIKTFHSFRISTVNFLHTSFPDFLLDSSRSGEFSVTTRQGFTDVAIGSLKRLGNKTFAANTCGCEDQLSCQHSLDSEITHYLSLFWSARDATPSQELQTAMLNHDSTDLLIQNDTVEIEKSKLGVTLIFIERFFDMLQTSSAFKDSNTIFEHHIANFNSFLKSELAKCEKHHMILDALALFSCLENNMDHDTGGYICCAIELLVHLQSESSIHTLRKAMETQAQAAVLDSKNLLHSFWPVVISGLPSLAQTYGVPNMPLKYLQDFLQKPERSGRYHVDSESLIRATARCISLISSSSDTPGDNAKEALLNDSRAIVGTSVFLLLKQMWDEVDRPAELAEDLEGEVKFYYCLKPSPSIPKGLVSILRRRTLRTLDPQVPDDPENNMFIAYKNLEKLFEVEKYLPQEPSNVFNAYQNFKRLVDFRKSRTPTPIQDDPRILYLVISPLYRWFLRDKESWSPSEVAFEFAWCKSQ